MANISPPSNFDSSSAHRSLGGSTNNLNSTVGDKNKNDNVSSNKPRRFPDYILCGSLNLHKSPVNAAALAKHIANQWQYLRINNSSVISSKQLEINRKPEDYGGLRDGKPLTVTEWNKLQREKLVEKRKQLAKAENLPPSGTSNQRGRGRSNSRSRGRSRGRGRGRGNAGSSLAVIDAPPRGCSRGRSRGNRRGNSHAGRGRGRGGTGSANARTGLNANKNNPPPKLNVKQPRLARRNLRDKGQLPRKRGPDKCNAGSQVVQMPVAAQAVPDTPTHSLQGNLHIDDEILPDIQCPTDQNAEANDRLIQLDGNISLSTSDSEESEDSTFANLYKPFILNNESETSIDPAAENEQAEHSMPFAPQVTSTQLSQASANDNVVQGLDDMIKAIRNEVASKMPQSIPQPSQEYLNSGSLVDTADSSTPQITLSPRSNLGIHDNTTLDRFEVDMLEQYGVSPSAFLYSVQEPCVSCRRLSTSQEPQLLWTPKPRQSEQLLYAPHT